MKSLRWLISNALLLGMSLGLLTTFGCILKYGDILIQEPSMPMLVSEIGLLVSITLLAVYNMVKIWR